MLLSNLLLLRSKWLDVNYFKATFAWRLFVGNSDSVFTACFTPEMICLLFVSKKAVPSSGRQMAIRIRQFALRKSLRAS